jgi:folylpolyglutamate synthase/dihydropteroate synthase
MKIAKYMLFTGFIINRNVPHKSMKPALVAHAAHAAGYRNYEVIEDPSEAFAAILQRPEPIVLVAGSFYLLNSIRPIMGVDVPAAHRF